MYLDKCRHFLILTGACNLQAVAIRGKLEARDDFAFKEWQRTVGSVIKWLKKNDKNADDEALETIARSRS